MSSLCREFGISRKTGYKLFERVQGVRSGGGRGPHPRPFPLLVSCLKLIPT